MKWRLGSKRMEEEPSLLLVQYPPSLVGASLEYHRKGWGGTGTLLDAGGRYAGDVRGDETYVIHLKWRTVTWEHEVVVPREQAAVLEVTEAVFGTPEDVAAAEKASRQAQDQARAEENAAVLKVGKAEVRSGRCEATRLRTFRNLLTSWKAFTDDRREPGVGTENHYTGELTLADARIVVANERGTKVTFGSTFGGSFYVLANGCSPVSLEVRDERGRTTGQLASFSGFGGEGDCAGSSGSAARLLRSVPTARYEVTVKGTGCVLVTVFRISPRGEMYLERGWQFN